jgi:hypothetical protein
VNIAIALDNAFFRSICRCASSFASSQFATCAGSLAVCMVTLSNGENYPLGVFYKHIDQGQRQGKILVYYATKNNNDNDNNNTQPRDN